MNWFWIVRLYRPTGDYWNTFIELQPGLAAMDVIRCFYEEATGCKMLIEGMTQKKPHGMPDIKSAFLSCWGKT